MTYKIFYTKNYNKIAKKFIKRHPKMLPTYEKTLQLLEINPFHPSLRLHQLKGSLKNLHSISLNLSYRVTLELIIEDKKIIPVNIGNHDDVY